MTMKNIKPGFRVSRSPNQLGDRLAKRKIDEARKLTPEHRLLLALELSGAVTALQRGCSNER